MDFDQYQRKASETAIYPEENAVQFLSLGINGESGEVAEKVKKSVRDGEELELEKELGDVLWYLSALASELDLSLEEIAEKNIEKIKDREERNLLKGEGDKR